MTTYKWLRPDHRGAYGHGDYTAHLPHGTRPGKWLPAVAAPKPCARGYHVVDIAHLPAHWGIPGVLYEAETRGKTVEDGDKLACESIRLVRRVGELTPGIAATFAADCAERGTGAVRGEVPRRRPSAQGHRSGAGLHRRPDAGEPSRRLGRRAPPGPPGPPGAAWTPGPPPGPPSTPPGRRGRLGRLGRRLGRPGRRRRQVRRRAAWAAEREWQGAHLIELLEAAS